MRPGIREHRCPRCEIRKPLCFCSHIPQITLQTRVVILMHTFEEPLTTNTAKLVNKALLNSEIQIHGKKDERLIAASLHRTEGQSLLLYPSPFAVELSPEFVANLARPTTLVVPDANWRQTTKFVRREPALEGIPHVKLPLGLPSEYRLKTQRHESGLCTLEAIARAIGLLESPEAQKQLELLLRVMVERTLWTRGKLPADQCLTAGIPLAAFQHDQKGFPTTNGPIR
jgi:DTW domain-containing protein YfiP